MTLRDSAHQKLREARWALRSASVRDTVTDYSTARFIVGSPRSGTTWLQEVACASGGLRPIFEPFSFKRVELFSDVPRGRYIAPDANEPDLARRVTAVLDGSFRSPWSDQLARMHPAARTQGRVAKEIRSLTWLGWMGKQFPRMPIALLVRHPLAVASSSVALGWEPRFFKPLMIQTDLVTTHLLKQQGRLEALETPWERTIAVWCIENYVALRTSANLDNIMVVSYEETVANRVVLGEVLQHFAIQGMDQTVIERGSSMSRKGSSTALKGYSSSSWLRTLDKAQIDSAMAVLSLFGFDQIFHPNGSVDVERLLNFR